MITTLRGTGDVPSGNAYTIEIGVNHRNQLVCVYHCVYLACFLTAGSMNKQSRGDSVTIAFSFDSG